MIAILALSGLLLAFLYAILVIALIGGLIWAINIYIAPIPPPILMVVAVVLVICVILWMVEGGNPILK